MHKNKEDIMLRYQLKQLINYLSLGVIHAQYNPEAQEDFRLKDAFMSLLKFDGPVVQRCESKEEFLRTY